jgi:hypothetical protein
MDTSTFRNCYLVVLGKKQLLWFVKQQCFLSLGEVSEKARFALKFSELLSAYRCDRCL